MATASLVVRVNQSMTLEINYSSSFTQANDSSLRRILSVKIRLNSLKYLVLVASIVESTKISSSEIRHHAIILVYRWVIDWIRSIHMVPRCQQLHSYFHRINLQVIVSSDSWVSFYLPLIVKWGSIRNIKKLNLIVRCRPNQYIKIPQVVCHDASYLYKYVYSFIFWK